MKLATLVVLLVIAALAGCVSVHRQTVTSGWGGNVGLCQRGTVNGKDTLLCASCMSCPVGQKCQAKGEDGFYRKCK